MSAYERIKAEGKRAQEPSPFYWRHTEVSTAIKLSDELVEAEASRLGMTHEAFLEAIRTQFR